MNKQKGATLVEASVIVSILILLILIVGSFLATKAHACWFCSSGDTNSTNLQQNEQQDVSNNQSKMETAVPLPNLSNSLERTNIKKRLEAFNDPNKVSYIYLISFGRVMSFYTIKGKVTSGGKRLSSTQRQVDAQSCTSGNCTAIMESPELDGTYGNSSPYVFFWTTEGVYVQWSGDYMLVDQPLQLTSQPELVRQIK